MYMKFNIVRLDAHLLNGKHAVANIVFQDGCNIILTNSNTQGKSSVINSLAIALGFDELVKGNISALVNDTIKIQGVDQPIVSAYVYLQIENQEGDFFSIKREVRPDLSEGVAVLKGPLSQWDDASCEEYYLGKGSYTDSKGFHRALSEFIGFPEIKVVSQDDAEMRLYLEYIFSAIFIEQKRGWADIMSNSPYYRVRDPKKSTVAEILGMDYIKNNLQRNTLKLEVDRLKAIYEGYYETLKQYVNSRHFSLRGLPQDINSEVWSPTVYQSFEGQKNVSLKDFLIEKKEKLSSIEVVSIDSDANPELEKKLFETSELIRENVHQKNELDRVISSLEGAVKRYQQRMDVLDSDLKKNKEEQKIKKLFAHDGWSVKEHCPVCEQKIDESLLSQVRSFPTMSIDDNIKYINEQRKLLKDVLSVEEERKSNALIESQRLDETIKSLMSQISDIQKSLSGAIPAEIMVQAREVAKLEQEVEILEELNSYSLSMFEKIKEIFDRYHVKNKRLQGIKSDLSKEDKSLLRQYGSTFKSYLGKLGYNSFEIDSIFIDEATFMPRVRVEALSRKKNIRADFGSSASDWIRIITAYTLALHASRNNSEKSNHPNVSIFDEPAQQNMDMSDHLELYPLISEVCQSGGQVIMAATDKNHTVKQKAQNLDMNVIDFGANFILQEQEA